MLRCPNPWTRRLLLAFLTFVLLFNLGGVVTVRVQATAGDLGPTEEELLTPPPFRMAVEEVAFLSEDGVQLSGWFLPGSPAGEGSRRATVLLLPGSGKGGHPHAALSYGPLLVEAGYNVLAFSYRGHGRSGGSTYGGTLVSMERLIQDAEAALRFLRSRPEVGEQPVGSLGCSLGTGVGLGLAARTKGLRALVLDSTWSDLPTSQETQARLRGQGWQNHIPYFWHLLRWWTSLAFGVDMTRNEPITFATELGQTPVFFIHGATDLLLHARQSELLYARTPGPKQLWIPEGVGHCEGRFASDREFKAQVLAFFRRWLLDGADQGFSLEGVSETSKVKGREVRVTLSNATRETLSIAISLHRPGNGRPPEVVRVLLPPGPGVHSLAFNTESPFEFATAMRYYQVQTQGPSWIEALSPDARGWRSMKAAERWASQGRHDEAEAAYQEAQQFAPQNPRYAFEAGVYYFRRGLYEKASQSLFRVLTTPLSQEPGADPRQWPALAFVAIGWAHDLKGERAAAVEAYQKAREFAIPLATRWAENGLKKAFGAK